MWRLSPPPAGRGRGLLGTGEGFPGGLALALWGLPEGLPLLRLASWVLTRAGVSWSPGGGWVHSHGSVPRAKQSSAPGGGKSPRWGRLGGPPAGRTEAREHGRRQTVGERVVDGQTDRRMKGKRNFRGGRGSPGLEMSAGPEGGQRRASVLPRRASAAAPCSARPSRSATSWWTPLRTWPPAPRTCAAAPRAPVPPSRSTLASAPMRGDSPGTGGAPTSAVSGSQQGRPPHSQGVPGDGDDTPGQDVWRLARDQGQGELVGRVGRRRAEGTRLGGPGWVPRAELTPEARRAQRGYPGGPVVWAPLPAASPRGELGSRTGGARPPKMRGSPGPAVAHERPEVEGPVRPVRGQLPGA